MIQLENLPLDHKDVILRVDFNVPLTKDGEIIDDTRLKASIPTIKYLLDKNCRIILISHLGRPKQFDKSQSLELLVNPLEKILHKPVFFISSLDSAKQEIDKLPHPSICLLENLRFNQAEEDPSIDPNFAKHLASLGQYYVNDAFACAHRPHSSVTEIAKYFKGRCAAGFLMTHEINELSKVLTPLHPFYLLLGGSKISTKIGVIDSLLPKCDALFIGGAMAFPFIKALDISIGSFKIDQEQIEQAKRILEEAKQKEKAIYLPYDWSCKTEASSSEPVKIFTITQGVPAEYQPFDIGPATIHDWSKKLKNAQTIFWNGPLGMYETSPFDQGTNLIAEAISNIKCESIVGGGDSVAAIEKHNLNKGFSHLSTGGGASLEFLEKQSLPGIEALKQ